MHLSLVAYERRGPIALLTLNRPDNANVLDLATGRELQDAARRCATDDSVRAVVLTGAGKNFCFGGDLRGMMASGADVQGYLRDLTVALHGAIQQFTTMPAPVIAAVNGTAAGAGVGLVAMADLSIAGESSKISLAYTGVALTPDGSTSWFLPRLIGVKRTMELILTNRPLAAAEALQWGLFNQVVADAEVLNSALALAERLANGPRGAYGLAKGLVAASTSDGATLASQLETESQTISAQAATPEGQEGIRAFLDKRKPRYL